ncbi:MAG: hypothetical protein KAU26_02905 [Methylococcales bacterium]|nr:hypothetical protein [Methylococcales bacterium]
MILTSHKLTKELTEKAITKAVFKVIACIFNKIYEIGRKVSDGFKESMKIVFDRYLKLWNYVAILQPITLEVAWVISCTFLTNRSKL